MRYSIIIPTFNSHRYISKCLQSVFKLNYSVTDYEVIVVDGGSSDNTLHEVKQFDKIRILSSPNLSISNNRNMGAAKALGENLVFIDSDCKVDRNLLQKADRILKDYECCGSFYKPDNEHGWVAKTWLDVERKKDGIVKWITSGTLIVKKKIFEQVGGFNESLQTEEDEDFGYRIRVSGGQLFCDYSMASVHLGQADNILDFFKKEMWRGRSLIGTGINKNSKKYSLFDTIIVLYLFLLIAMILSFFFKAKFIFFFFLGIIFLLPLMLAVRKIWLTRKIHLLLKTYFLYIVYLLARSWSLFRYNQFVSKIKRLHYGIIFAVSSI